jgi:hypothetical protein
LCPKIEKIALLREKFIFLVIGQVGYYKTRILEFCADFRNGNITVTKNAPKKLRRKNSYKAKYDQVP